MLDYANELMSNPNGSLLSFRTANADGAKPGIWTVFPLYIRVIRSKNGFAGVCY